MSGRIPPALPPRERPRPRDCFLDIYRIESDRHPQDTIEAELQVLAARFRFDYRMRTLLDRNDPVDGALSVGWSYVADDALVDAARRIRGGLPVLAVGEILPEGLRRRLLPHVDRLIQGRGSNSLKWAVRSLLANRNHPGRVLAYGTGRWRSGDIRLPDAATRGRPWPIAILLHGGFWDQPYERDMVEELAVDLPRIGVATFNLDYTPRQAATWPVPLADIEAALSQIAAASVELEIDPTRIFLVGHSAGAHLSLMAGAQAEAAGRPVRGVWALAPLTDLHKALELGLGNNAVAALLGAEQPSVGQCDAASPICRPLTRTPVILVHGDRDTTVPLEQSQAYARAVAKAGGEVELLVFENAAHMDLTKGYGSQWRCVVDRIRDWVNTL